MIEKLQDISFKVSRYFRPLETWHCGGLADGSQCLLGPDKQGKCRAITDCTPEQQEKTWVCTRSELLGGACKSGPGAHGACGRQRPPCQPIRSVRSRRSRFVWVAAAGVLALTMLIASLDTWQAPLNPGKLSKHHASFGATDCVACHAAAELPRGTWWQNIFSGEPAVHTGLNDDQRCVSCHSLGADSLAVHSLPAEQRQQLTNVLSNAESGVTSSSLSLLTLTAKRLNSAGEAPACTACHQEHKGSEAHISMVSDQQCSVCHTNAFDDFSAHAEFSNYPADRRTRIIFSHNSHLNKHFSEAEFSELAPAQCLDCHLPDPVGRKMEVKGFDETCSACHIDQVTGESRAGDKGFAMLTIPGLDVDTLQERGVGIGAWPEFSDAELTPLTLMFIAAVNPKVATQFDTLSGLDLFDLSSASDAELELVYEVSWGLKQAFFELSRGGVRALKGRLNSVLNVKDSPQSEIFGRLSPAVIDQAVADAFPNLEAEMQAWLQSGTPKFSLSPIDNSVDNPAPLAADAPASVESDSADDDWLSSALDDTDEESDDDWLSGALDDDDSSSEESDDEDWLNAASDVDESDGEDWLNEVSSDDSTDEDDWLSGALDEDSSDDDDWLNDVADDDATALDDDADVQVMDADDQSVVALKVMPEQLSLEDRAAAGGWYYESYTLRYRPAGHADSFITAWIEQLAAAQSSDGAAASIAKSMQRSLLGDSTPGNCLKCHSVDQQSDQLATMVVNWHGAKTAPSNHDFNAFSHQSHFAVVDGASNDFATDEANGCRSCHLVDSESDSSASYKANDPHVFASDFHNLQKDQCATCHEAEPALAQCTQCHNYHIGERGLTGIEDGFKSVVGGQ